ncbi:hypothetical protein Gferi_10825 [Geosporobacter ferrireducens]|uniref:DUF2922 domain-containing protein n=2 Tax=Geosporobacter ferrireducens TaxID=1424294 RepID=A0A1D8GQ93_9FIRM|nr:hypothetical protein Gferi_10825 [Geosporobacter ferrireducens]
MVFKNQLGRTNKITVENAKIDLSESDVQAAMQTIIEKNIFKTSGGDFVAIEGAKIITTNVEELV